jgi:hypothetical protein
LRAHPLLRAACEADARLGNALYLALPAEERWFARDVGRYGICMTAMLLELMGLLTLQTLTAAAAIVSSAGRADALVERAMAVGMASIEPGDAPRGQRPLRLGQPLHQLIRNRTRGAMLQSLPLVPNAADLNTVLDDEALLSQFLLRAAQITTERRDLFAFWSGRPVDHFAQREAGMLLLQDMLLSQAPGRQRTLEAAPLSRYRLARTYGVSRAHINKLMSDSAFVEATDNDIVFDPRLSHDYERYFLTNVMLGSVAARDVCSGWRYPMATA